MCILGFGIIVFLNFVLLNIIIIFNFMKGIGSDVKYCFDFGDGFVFREFLFCFLFN